MKIYTHIDSTFEEQSSFKSYLDSKGITAIGWSGWIDNPTADLEGFYCIDNSTKNVEKFSTNPVPDSYLIKWDSMKIDDLYENRVIGRFNQGKIQWSQMDAGAMEPMIRVLMYGAEKYDRGNWAKACPKRLDLMDSLMRHSMKIIAGESIDSESGLPHIGHLMCNAMFYSYWEQKTNGQFENLVVPTK